MLEVFQRVCADSSVPGQRLGARVITPRSTPAAALTPGGLFAELVLRDASEDGVLSFDVVRLHSLSYSMPLDVHEVGDAVSTPADPDRLGSSSDQRPHLCVPRRARVYARLEGELARFVAAEHNAELTITRFDRWP